jgi:hypothetical protein
MALCSAREYQEVYLGRETTWSRLFVQGSPARTLVSWRLRSEEKRDPWFFFYFHFAV